MDNTKFKKLAYNQKKQYLLSLFLTIRNVYPIYDRCYILLSKENNIDIGLLDRLYDAITKIKQTTHETLLIKEKKSKGTLKEIEDKDKKKDEQSVSEMEKLFI